MRTGLPKAVAPSDIPRVTTLPRTDQRVSPIPGIFGSNRTDSAEIRSSPTPIRHCESKAMPIAHLSEDRFVQPLIVRCDKERVIIKQRGNREIEQFDGLIFRELAIARISQLARFARIFAASAKHGGERRG
jgi:hypothetical protein